jgi:hypothetical protein
MVVSPAGLGTKNGCAGEGKQQFINQPVKNYGGYTHTDTQVER